MPPLEVRRSARKFADEHPDASIIEAYIAGAGYHTEEPASAKEQYISFGYVWELYDRKDNKASAIKAWNKLSQKDKLLVVKHVPAFVKAHPDKQFRPMLSTYLNQHRFEDEEIISNGEQDFTPEQKRFSAYAQAINDVGRKG